MSSTIGSAAARAYDERAPDGVGSAAYPGLRAHVAQELASRGVTFGDTPFMVDPVPRVFDAGEWSALEGGAAQRVSSRSPAHRR